MNKMTACVRHTSGTGVGLFVWWKDVGAVYGVHSVCGTLSVFRATFRRICKVSLGRTVILYTLHRTKGRVASATVTRQARVTPSRASGIVHTMRSGKLVQQTLNRMSGHRVCFDLARTNGGHLGRLSLSGMRVPRVLGPLVWIYGVENRRELRKLSRVARASDRPFSLRLCEFIWSIIGAPLWLFCSSAGKRR